jgi:hypothetical protein
MVYRITPASSHQFELRPDRSENMRFRIGTMMIAVVIVSLVTALVVLGWRAREEIRRAHVELEVAKTRATLAEALAKIADARAESVEFRAKEVLKQSSRALGEEATSQKPSSRRPSVAQ